jgi:hypothetical protein
LKIVIICRIKEETDKPTVLGEAETRSEEVFLIRLLYLSLLPSM